MGHETIRDATLEQLEAAPAGSALKDGEGDRATKDAASGNWFYHELGIPFASHTVLEYFSPVRLTQPSRQ